MLGKYYEIVLNRESGTILNMGPEKVAELLEAVFADVGQKCKIRLVNGRDVTQALEQARDSDCYAVLVGGGDGTVASAASVMQGSLKPLGVLPLGTFNLAARDMGVPLDLEQATRLLLKSPIHDIDLMEMDGKFFLCVVVLGFYPAMAIGRREYHGNWVVKAWKSGCEVMKNMVTFPPLDLVFKQDNQEKRFRTRFAILANNDYADTLGMIPLRKTLDAGHFTVYVSNHRTRRGYVWSLVKWLIGKWKTDKELTVFQSNHLEISARRKRKMAIMCDGELDRIKLPFSISLRHQALKVLLPRLLAEQEEEQEKEPSYPAEPA